MISLLSLIFIVAKNITLATLSSLAAVLPLTVQCHRPPLPTSVDCFFYGRQSQRDDFVIGHAPPPPSSTSLLTSFVRPSHRHCHPLVDCCSYGGSSALMTDTHGPSASHLSDTGQHNTGSAKLGLGWEQLRLLLRRRLQRLRWLRRRLQRLRRLRRLRRGRHDARQKGQGGLSLSWCDHT